MVDRLKVVDTAIKLADKRGLEQLSIRSLASELSMAPMSLYKFFRTKEELKDLMLINLLNRMELPHLISADWRQHLAAKFTALSLLLMKHPVLVELLVTQRVTSLGLARLADSVISDLCAAGVNEIEAVKIYAALFSLTLGSAAYALPRQYASKSEAVAANTEVSDQLRSYGERHNLYYARELSDELSSVAQIGVFEIGVRLILEGITSELSR